MFWGQNLVTLFHKGGFAMWPLLFCSMIGSAIILERLVYFQRIRLNYKSFTGKLKGLIAANHLREAEGMCRKNPHPVARIAAEYLRRLDNDLMRDEVLKREGSAALEKVEARLRGLAAITHIAPLLGLLGTVAGLVSAFHQIELLGGQVQPSDLAQGIWAALVTTVFGLVIAIPCMAAYHGFESEADRIARHMQFIVSEMNEIFGKHSDGSFKTGDAETTQNQMQAVQ